MYVKFSMTVTLYRFIKIALRRKCATSQPGLLNILVVNRLAPIRQHVWYYPHSWFKHKSKPFSLGSGGATDVPADTGGPSKSRPPASAFEFPEVAGGNGYGSFSKPPVVSKNCIKDSLSSNTDDDLVRPFAVSPMLPLGSPIFLRGRW